jgi:hypothetical protein
MRTQKAATAGSEVYRVADAGGVAERRDKKHQRAGKALRATMLPL